MASPLMASSSLPYTSGNVVVVTHVLPAAPNVEQQPLSDGRHRFRRGHPKALGTVQIVIGVITLLFGIATAIYQPSLGVYSGIFVWGALIYIASGSVTVAAEKSLSRCLITSSLVLNIIAAVVAVTGVILYALDPAVFYGSYGPYGPYGSYGSYGSDGSYGSYGSYHSYGSYNRYYYGGYSVVVAVFQFLEFIISITVAAYACKGTCGCCCSEQPQVFVQTAENVVTSQAPPHFQAASVAPAQPHPQVDQVAPNFKNPGDLSSAEPPPYQPI